jgi:uncharacterized protein YciI
MTTTTRQTIDQILNARDAARAQALFRSDPEVRILLATAAAVKPLKTK